MEKEVFDNEFVSTKEGRASFLAALSEPAFVKASNEFFSACFPHGTGCTCCQQETKIHQQEKWDAMSNEERWIPVVDDVEDERQCNTCLSTDGVTRQSSVWCHLRICNTCFLKK